MSIFIGEGKEIKTGEIIGMNIELNRRNFFLGRVNSVGKMMHQHPWNFLAVLFWLYCEGWGLWESRC